MYDVRYPIDKGVKNHGYDEREKLAVFDLMATQTDFSALDTSSLKMKLLVG